MKIKFRGILETIVDKFELYVLSADFCLSIVITGIYLGYLYHRPGGITRNVALDIAKDFGIYIPIISILITLFTLSLTVLITAIPKDFLLYLEDRGKIFSKLKEIHLWGFFIYFCAIAINVMLQVYVNIELGGKLESYTLLSWEPPSFVTVLYSIDIFLTVYSFLYTWSLIRIISDLIGYRVRFIKSKSQKSKTGTDLETETKDKSGS